MGQFIEPMQIYNTPGGADDPPSEEIEFQFVSFASAYIDLNQDGRTERIVGYGGGPISVFAQQEDASLQIADFYSSMKRVCGWVWPLQTSMVRRLGYLCHQPGFESAILGTTAAPIRQS